jgi:CRISPR/Cas system-associated exonuclease Cas4 (RecB family)
LQAKCAAITLGRIPEGAEPEVALAYDPEADRAERLVLGAARHYPSDARVYGTADLVGVRGGAAFVADYKTGVKKVNARDSMQLRFYALAASRVAGVAEAHVEMLYLRHDGSWSVDAADFDEFVLDETREELRAIRAAQVNAVTVVERGGLPELMPGPHCEYCPASAVCPAQDARQKALLAVPDGDLASWYGGLSVEQASDLLEQSINVSKAAERIREVGNARAAEMPEGLPLPSGRVLKRVQYSVQKLSPVAKAELAAKREELRERMEITVEKTWQVRVVGGARRKEAV